MIRYTILGFFSLACTQETAKTTTEETEFDFVDTANPSDTAEPVSLLEEGQWSLTEPELISDPCNVNNFNDVSEMVPTQLEVSNVSETGFNIDDDVFCTLEGSLFSCEEQHFSEETWGATIEIRNQMEGKMLTPTSLNVGFTVTLLSCSDNAVVCGLMETVMDLPCTLMLETTASH